MKKILIIILTALFTLSGQAQTAKQVLDKTAAVIGRKGGAQAASMARLAEPSISRATSSMPVPTMVSLYGSTARHSGAT